MKAILKIIIGILLLFVLVNAFLSFSYVADAIGYIIQITAIVASVMVLVYFLYDYKIPHGNLLRYAFFIFAVCTLLYALAGGSIFFATGCILGIAALAIAYISGRLNKLQKNCVLIPVVAVLFLASSIIDVATMPAAFTSDAAPEALRSSFEAMQSASAFQRVLSVFGRFSLLIQWIGLAGVYRIDFKRHHEAGLAADSEKAK